MKTRAVRQARAVLVPCRVDGRFFMAWSPPSHRTRDQRPRPKARAVSGSLGPRHRSLARGVVSIGIMEVWRPRAFFRHSRPHALARPSYPPIPRDRSLAPCLLTAEPTMGPGKPLSGQHGRVPAGTGCRQDRGPGQVRTGEEQDRPGRNRLDVSARNRVTWPAAGDSVSISCSRRWGSTANRDHFGFRRANTTLNRGTRTATGSPSRSPGVNRHALSARTAASLNP